MMCCGWKGIAGQAAVIVLVGGAIGVADSRIRKVNLGARPEPLPVSTKSSGDANARASAPGNGSPATIETASPAAAAPAFKAITRDELNKIGEKGQGQITLDEAKALYDEQAVFVDARSAEKYAVLHIKGAFNISEEDFRHGNPLVLMAIPRDAKLVVYCTGGQCDESEQVARMLNGSGYGTVYVLHDGIPGWEAMGWPTEKGAQ